MRKMRLGITLAAGLVCIALGACSKREQEASADSEFSEIQIQEERQREADAKARDEERAAAVKRSMKAIQQSKEPTSIVDSQSVDKPDPEEEKWKRIEDKMFIRYLAVRDKIGTITVGDEIFEEAAISGVDHKGLTVTHKTGKKDLLYTELPAGLRAKMLVDNSEAEDIARGVHLPKLPRKRANAVRDRVVEARKMHRPAVSPTTPPGPEITKAPSKNGKKEEDPYEKRLRIAEEKRKKTALAVRDAEYQLDALNERLIEIREGDIVKRSQNDPLVRKATNIVEDKKAFLERLKATHQAAQDLVNQVRDEQFSR